MRESFIPCLLKPRKFYRGTAFYEIIKTMKQLFQNLRNQLDFFTRSHVRWERHIPDSTPIPPLELGFQNEIREFLELLVWEKTLQIAPKKAWVVCDVGAKNFSLAPLIDQLFLEREMAVEIHGVEVDAYRRLANFYTRADYGNFFSRKARKATFHPINFLKFEKQLDGIFLLNPFVSSEPLLRWGLPLNQLRPQDLFRHAFDLLKEKSGWMILSSPSPEEFHLASQYATSAGFYLGPPAVWKPQAHHIQKKPRFGCLCYSTAVKVSDSGNRGSV